MKEENNDIPKSEEYPPIYQTSLNKESIEDGFELMIMGALRVVPSHIKLTLRQKFILSIFSRIELSFKFWTYTAAQLSEIISEPVEKVEKDLKKLIRLKLLIPFSLEEMERIGIWKSCK